MTFLVVCIFSRTNYVTGMKSPLPRYKNISQIRSWVENFGPHFFVQLEHEHAIGQFTDPRYASYDTAVNEQGIGSFVVYGAMSDDPDIELFSTSRIDFVPPFFTCRWVS